MWTVVQGLYHLVLYGEKQFRERVYQGLLYANVRECSNYHVNLDVFFDLVYIFLRYSFFILSLYNDVIVFLRDSLNFGRTKNVETKTKTCEER